MKKMTPYEREQLLEIIPEGEEKAISMGTLASMFSTSAREIRQVMYDLRTEGHIIAGTNTGYFKPVTTEELMKYYKMGRARALSGLQSLKAARKELIARGIKPDGAGKRKAKTEYT